MASSEILRFAGDVNIEKVRVISSNGFFQDVANQTVGIQIFEDLFSPFITGSLVIKDSLDLVNLFPFTGEEFLELKISTPTYKKSKIDSKFYIFKMTNREMVGDRSVVYELHFISLEAIIDLNKKVSKSFGGKVSDLANLFITDKTNGLQTSKKVFVEPTSNSTKFISNFWSPIKCLSYLAEQATNVKKVPNYVFYENRVGFNFVSLDSLYDNSDAIQEFFFDNYVRDSLPVAGDIKNIEKDYKRINELNIPLAYDYMQRISSGMYGSKMFTHDAVTKQYQTRNFDYFQAFEKQKHLNPYALASKNNVYRYNSAHVRVPKSYSLFTGYGDVTNSKTAQFRLSAMMQADSNKIQIVVPGKTDYTVGQKVAVLLNKMQPVSKNDEDYIDKVFSGFYLIGAINHFITRDKHECTMELFKDSSVRNLDGNKK